MVFCASTKVTDWCPAAIREIDTCLKKFPLPRTWKVAAFCFASPNKPIKYWFEFNLFFFFLIIISFLRSIRFCACRQNSQSSLYLWKIPQRVITSAKDECWGCLLVWWRTSTTLCTCRFPFAQQRNLFFKYSTEVKMDTVCCTVLLQPAFFQPLLFQWAIKTKFYARQFSTSVFCVRLSIKAVVKVKQYLKWKKIRSCFLKVYKANLKKNSLLVIAPEISF